MLLGFRPTRAERTANVRRGVVGATIGVVIVTVPLTVATMSSLKQLETGVIVKNTLAYLVSSDIADVRDLSIEFGENQSLIEFTAYPFSDPSSAEQSDVRRDRMMQLLQKQLKDELSDPFAIRALIIDSQLKQASSETAQP